MPLPREQCKVIDAFIAEKAKSGTVRESKSPHSTPTFCVLMPQGLSNAPATFNRLITQLFRPLRTFAETYFDDIFVHSRAEGG
ncbi:Polyprotein [Phytophthora palmivora]|uniref:Polyprotein n=1 Tax=Phytophthora palmivora TaxID=4796 RepID=A0A2P4XR07_9STRA|nr:Polyprotein [Phytophthora palmivora]